MRYFIVIALMFSCSQEASNRPIGMNAVESPVPQSHTLCDVACKELFGSGAYQCTNWRMSCDNACICMVTLKPNYINEK